MDFSIRVDKLCVVDLRRMTDKSLLKTYSRMKSIWITEAAVLLLCVVAYETAASESQSSSSSSSSCPKRHLMITVDDHLKLYYDGIEVQGLPNQDNVNRPDIVALPCTTRLIAIHGRNGPYGNVAGILASTADEYVLTGSSWKCSNVSELGWTEIGFDDSYWKYAVEYGRNGQNEWVNIPVISNNAAWIWLRQWTADHEAMDKEIFCRKTISTCYGSTPIIVLGVFFGLAVLAIVALIAAFWFLRKK